MKWFKTLNNIQTKDTLTAIDSYSVYENKEEVSKELYKEVLEAFGNEVCENLFEGRMVEIPFLGRNIITKMRP